MTIKARWVRIAIGLLAGGILAWVLIPSISRIVISRNPHDEPGFRTRTNLRRLSDHVRVYHVRFGHYPPGDAAGLIAELSRLPGFELDESLLAGHVEATIVDQWGRPIRYCYSPDGQLTGQDAIFDEAFQQNNRCPLLVSAGANGRFGDSDDIIVGH